MGLPKVDEATTIALEAIRDAAPALLTVTEVSKKVASAADVSVGTARSRVRAAFEAGGLLELKPWSRKFFIELPGAEAAGLGPFYIAREWTGTGREHRHVITTDDSAMRPSSYGPGNTTYVADPEQIREYVQRLTDEKKAKEDAEAEAWRNDRKAQVKEIARRFPGLRKALRMLELLGTFANPTDAHGSMLTARVYLDTSRHQAQDAPVSERNSNMVIQVEGDENVGILQTILSAGLSSLLAEQPVTHCKHCSGRILYAQARFGTGWWHVDTTNGSCGEDTDTKAEPAETEEN
jgi:hypothetical protein